MSDFVRFHGSGRVNQVQEMSTIKGKPFARLWLGIGGDATKSESVVRVDFWGEDVCHDWPWWLIQFPYFIGKIFDR